MNSWLWPNEMALANLCELSTLLLFNRLSEGRIVDILENKERFRNFPELLQGPIQGMLSGMGVQALEELRGGRHFQPDGRDEAQDLVPLLMDQCHQVRGHQSIY